MSRNTIQLPSIEALKEDASALGHEAAELAEKRILRPARRLASEARHAVSAGTERTEEMLCHQRDLASGWIAAHPFAAVGIALGAGLVLNSLLRGRR